MSEAAIHECPRCGQKNRVRAGERARARCGRCQAPLGAAGPGGPAADDGGAAAGDGRPVAVTDATYDREVLQAPGLVLVDFWAPWCGPCRTVAPVLEKAAERFRGRLKIAKVNTDQNPRVAAQLGIQSIPTLLLYRGGQVIDRQVGAVPGPQLEAWLARHAA
jgi:thioredoxin